MVSGKELSTDTLDTSDISNASSSPRLSTSGSTDISLRLQTMIATWKGAQNGLALATLHQECINAAGLALFPRLLPVQVLFVTQLDATTLQRTLQGSLRRRHGGKATTIQFRVPPSGRFDAALVPTGKEGYDRYLLALDDALSVRDQVALYGHAVGHLLLNYQEEQLGHFPELSPRNGYSHADTLAELRFLETTRQSIDRRVLNTFEPLRLLLAVPQESRSDFDAATADLRRQLAQAGWDSRFMEIRYQFTDGRISTSSTRRAARLTVDALLRASPSLPIAIVHGRRAGESREHAMRVLHDTAQRMALPFAYLLEHDGSIQEFDWSASSHAHTPVETQRNAFPTREALFDRWMQVLHLTNPKELQTLRTPYYQGSKKLRYYQEAAINQTVIAVLQARRGLRVPRLLLTMATGTGKTKVAFQLLWKLKRSGAVRNVLFLTDRDFLVSQAMDNEFAPFGDARYRLEGQPSTAYDVNFALYQSIVGPDHDYYLTYPADFFEVIVIDECHRGSAQETSEWRKVLTHFSSAVQIGLTATPLSTDTVQTDEYFGPSLYQYSLQMGINDGFLAPYRVRRVLIDSVEVGTDVSRPNVGYPAMSGRDESVPTLIRQGSVNETAQDEDEQTFVDIPASMESAATMRRYTKPIAQHLAEFLQRTDIHAKTIVFCVDQAHAEDMRIALHDACSSWMPTKDDYVVRVVSDERAEGKRALGNFTTPDETFPVIVTTSKLLSTGVDVPTCKNIVLARPVGSLVEFKQIIGRGTRLFPPQKSWFTILDYAGTIKHFFDPDFDGDPEDVVNEPLIPEPVPEPISEPVASSEMLDMQYKPVSITQVKQDEQDEQGIQQEPNAQQDVMHDTPVAPSPATTAQEQASEQVTYQSEEACTSTASVSSQSALYHAQEANNDIATPVPVTSDTIAMDGQEHRQQRAARAGEAHSPEAGETGNTSSSPSVPEPMVVKQLKNGRVLKVIGEVVYELDADGRTLRRGTYRECAIETTATLVSTPQDLRTRWLHDEQRTEIIERLQDEGVDLDELAYQQHLMELDPLDLLLHVVFHEPIVTRQQRVERVRRTHTTFFARFEKNLLARAVLDVILEKYMRREAPDVSDVDLLPLLSLSDKHTTLELAQAFVDKDNKSSVRSVLKELQRLLYSV